LVEEQFTTCPSSRFTTFIVGVLDTQGALDIEGALSFTFQTLPHVFVGTRLWAEYGK
jgi:hypothetical protein